jgi:pyridoxal phosphate enzyme (YggS family)
MAVVSLDSVLQRVARAAQRVDRDPTSVRVVAVCKGRSDGQVMRLFEAGHRDFAENRAQALSRRAAVLPAEIRWHFVGPLQTNKVRLVRPVCHLLHSLDRTALIKSWVKGPGVPPPALLEVNVGREPQKAGVLPEDAADVLRLATDLGVEVIGLMAIPPMRDDAEQVRPFFRELVALRDSLAVVRPLPELSMGMSDDFEIAVEEGATVIRIGRAIFSEAEREGDESR